MTKRLLVTLFSTLLFAAIGVVVTMSMVEQHRGGWTGIIYYRQMVEMRLPAFARAFIPADGKINSVLAGSPAAIAGIENRDVVVAVDGIPIADAGAIRQRSEQRRRGEIVEYRIRRGNELRTVKVPLVSPLAIPSLSISAGITLFVALTYLAASILVLWTRPRSRAAWVFFWLCTVSAITFDLTVLIDLLALPHSGIESVTTRIGGVFIYLAIVLVGMVVTALLLHLALVFPKERPIVLRHPLLLRWIYCGAFVPIALPVLVIFGLGTPRLARVPAAVVFCAIAAVMTIRWVRLSSRNGVLATILDHPWTTQSVAISLLFLSLILVRQFGSRDLSFMLAVTSGLLWVVALAAIAILYSSATLWALYHGYRSSSREEKRQVRWPLWGMSSSVAITGVALILAFTLSTMDAINPICNTILIGLIRLSVILIPLSFTFAILKYRLMDIDVIIRKTVVYSFVTGIIIGAFFALVALLGTFLTRWLNVRDQTVTVFATLLIAAIFVPVRNRVQRFVDRRFLRRRMDLSDAEKLVRQEVVAARELEPMLRRIVEAVQQALQVRSVVIFAPVESEDVLQPLASIGVPDGVLRGLALDSAALGRVDAVAPVAGLRLQQDEWARMKRMQAETVVPMIVRGRLQGLMIVGSRLTGSMEDEDREFLRSISQQIALGIDNLSVSDEIRDYERALEIQRALLPKSMPRVDGVDVDATWKPARIVGGDYFDVFTLGPSLLGLCIADVAGKGMPAALLMASLQAAVKASAVPDISPAELCRKVSTIVTGTLTGGRFVTFFFAILDTRDMRLRYTNAGHNPPLLFRRDGEVSRLSAGGPVFARLMSGSSYVTTEERLHEDDLLVLFTDGVTEARNRDEEELGEQRLIDLVKASRPAASQIVLDIVDEVRAFSDGLTHDDVTVIALRVTRGADNVVSFTRAG